MTRLIKNTIYRQIITLVSSGVLFLLIIKNTHASYTDDFGSGARTLAMGGAGVSNGDDIYSSLLNPAALAYLKRGQLSFEYSRLHLNLSDGSEIGLGFAGIAWPFIKEEIIEESDSGLKSSTETVKAGGKITRTLSSAIMAGYKNLTLAGYYQENIFRLTYARFFGKRLAVGLTFKALSDEYIMDNYLKLSSVFQYGQKSSNNSYSTDGGFIWNPWPRFFIGVAGQDINEPEIGYLIKEKLPSTYRLGIGMRKSDSRYALDFSYRPTSPSKEMEISSGFEKIFRDKISLRGGFAWTKVSDGFSGWRISSGMGINLSESISLDYAIIYPLSDLKETYGSHYLSFMFQFGRYESSEELEPGSLERAYRELSEEKLRLETQLAKTESEKRKLEEVLIEEATSRIREKIKQTREAPQTTTATLQQKTDIRTGEIKNIAASRTHIVKKGDTLQTLAEKYYNDPKLWIEIYNANREDIGRGGALKVNQVLIIPPPPVISSPIQPAVTGRESTATSGGTQSSPIITEIKTEPSGAAKIVPISPISPPPAVISSNEKPLVVPVPVEKTEISTTTTIQQPAPLQEVMEQPSKTKTPTPTAKTTTQTTSKKTHIVKPGENLRSIAQKYYNNPEKWRDILQANKDKIIRGQVKPGIELTIP